VPFPGMRKLNFLFRNLSDSDRGRWPERKRGMFVDVGRFPCDVAVFADWTSALKKMFTTEDRIVAEANRWRP